MVLVCELNGFAEAWKICDPFILVALVLGSLGPLTYLFLRLGDSRAEPIFRFEQTPLED